MNQPLDIDVQDIDHLGIIAGIIDEIGIYVSLSFWIKVADTVDLMGIILND